MPTIFEPAPEWVDTPKLMEGIERLLRQLGVSGKYIGQTYLAFAVDKTIKDPTCVQSITKGLYSDTAKYYQTTASCVERCIRSVIRIIWERQDHALLDQIAGYHLEERPTNGEFIDLVASYFRHH